MRYLVYGGTIEGHIRLELIIQWPYHYSFPIKNNALLKREILPY